MISLAYAMVLIVAARGGHLLIPNSITEVKRKLRDCYLVGLPLYLSATLVASFIPSLSLIICSALWIFWCFAGVERSSAFGA